MPGYDCIRMVFTCNNYPQDWQEKLSTIHNAGMKYVAARPEVGASGTRHLQGLLIWKTRMPRGRTNQLFVQNGLPSYLAPMRGTLDQAFEYITKPETADGPLYALGEKPQRAKSGGEMWAERLDEIAGQAARGELDVEEHHDVRSRCYKWFHDMQMRNSKKLAMGLRGRYPYAVWFYGASRGGKTWTAQQWCERLNLSYYLLEESRGSVWADGYEGEDAIIVDDAAPSWAGADFLKSLLDKSRCTRLPTKGGHVYSQARLIIVTSVSHPSDAYIQGQGAAEILNRLDFLVPFGDKKYSDPSYTPPTLPDIDFRAN